MKILITCESSGTVREAFRALGHDAWSCDLLPADDNSPHHLQCDARDVGGDWDMMGFHPPCTHLSVSGARHFAAKVASGVQQEALEFVRWCMLHDCPWYLENPVSIISTRIRKPDQTIQPWQFGHGETKRTCLWLNDLPLIVPTNIVSGREARIHKMPPSPTRWKERSKTYPGIAAAFADQWGRARISQANLF